VVTVLSEFLRLCTCSQDFTKYITTTLITLSD
jgi:hypothetical protein